MPSLILTGYPAAGKTTVAETLKERALENPAIDEVVIINEASACPGLTKQQCYETSLSEKKTRAALKSAFDRAVATSNQKTLVILDSLNYIKGFRYELHCLSKAAGERHGILWILNRASIVADWNSNRHLEEEAYSAELLQELILRYEPPDQRNRWDKPLYTVDVAPQDSIDSKSEAVQNSVYNMHALDETLVGDRSKSCTTDNAEVPPTSKKPTKSAFSRAKRKPATTKKATSISTIKPLEPLSLAALSEFQTIKTKAQSTCTNDTPVTSDTAKGIESFPSSSQTETIKSLGEQLDDILKAFLASKQLKQGSSTRQHIAGNANVLSELDATTTRLASAIASAQTVHTGGKLQVSFGGSSFPMQCPRTIALPELRRLRKQYIQWASTHPPDDTTETGIAKSFLTYVEEQIK